MAGVVGSPIPNLRKIRMLLLLAQIDSPDPGGKGAGPVLLEINIKEIIMILNY